MIYYAIRQQIKYNGAHSRWTYLHYSVNIGYTNVSKRCRTLLDVDQGRRRRRRGNSGSDNCLYARY